MKTKLLAIAAIFAVFILAVGGSNQAFVSSVVTFDNYTSPTDNDLANYFNQTGTVTPSPYSQSPTGGITGGSVVGYSGTEYRATAVYTPSSFDLSATGASIPISLDVFYNGQLSPLAPSANAVRSFRLGLLDSKTSSFETYGNERRMWKVFMH